MNIPRRVLFTLLALTILAVGLHAQEKQQHGMGLNPSSPEELRSSPQMRIVPVARGERPSQLLLTQYLPPIGSQGRQGSCAGWATAYYGYTYWAAKQRKLTAEQLRDPKFQFSAAYVYNQCNGGIDSGTSFYAAFRVLREKGCASLAEMPYSETDHLTKPSEAAHARAEKFKARTAAVVSPKDVEPEKLKTLLAETREPVVLAIPIYSDFPSRVASDFVYRLTVDPKSPHGGHAITIVGYDDSRQAFRMVNSWGADWGDRGFLWLAEEFVQQHASEVWAAMPGGPVARAVPGRPVKLTAHVSVEVPPQK